MIREKIPVSDTIRSEILSVRCKVDVTFTITGNITVLTAPQNRSARRTS
jgi:hypothetical protein